MVTNLMMNRVVLMVVSALAATVGNVLLVEYPEVFARLCSQ